MTYSSRVELVVFGTWEEIFMMSSACGKAAKGLTYVLGAQNNRLI